jgi:hypothetical protein
MAEKDSDKEEKQTEEERPPEEPDVPAVVRDPRLKVAADSFGAYIKTKWVPPVICPVCKTNSWTFGDPVDLPIRFKESRAYSLFPVWCDNCSYTLFFQGITSGLFDKTGDPVPFEPPDEGPDTDEESKS